MPVPLKISLVDQVMNALLHKIAHGAIQGQLPGVRILARDMHVSVPTICQALHQLHRHGSLTKMGAKRRWQVTQATTAIKPRKQPSLHRRRKQLLFISQEPLSSQRHSGVQVFAQLLDLLASRNWDVMHRVIAFGAAKSSRQSWDNLLELTKPDAVVVLEGSPVIGHWLREHRQRAIFLGGHAGTSNIPMVAIHFEAMLNQAFEHLLASGHHCIRIPLLARMPNLVNNTRKLAASASHSPNRIAIIESAYSSPEVMVNLLRRQWRKATPDALIFLDWREFMAASSFFRDRQIHIPTDLSIIILSHNPTMDWHLPTLSHFKHPVNDMARTIAKWAQSRHPTIDWPTSIHLPTRLIVGQSIHPRHAP